MNIPGQVGIISKEIREIEWTGCVSLYEHNMMHLLADRRRGDIQRAGPEGERIPDLQLPTLEQKGVN